MAHGGKREGSGRKPKFAENELKEQILKATGETGLTEVWAKLFQEAKKGSIPHINTLLNYYYGKPKESLQVDGDMSIVLTRKVLK